MENETAPYNFLEAGTGFEERMPKRKLAPIDSETFGRRLARLRKAAGYTQNALASEIGISRRMLAYYEGQTEHPPTHLLPAIADALGLSADQLLGRVAVRVRSGPENQRLLRKLRQVERLPPRARRVVVETIDALVAKYGSPA